MAPISIADARRIVLAEAEHLASTAARERLPVGAALDRILAEDVTAAGDVPPFPSSAMDGYAVTAGPAGRRLIVSGESRAGRPSADALQDAGHAIRISTGAAVPPGATAVVRQEDTEPATGRGDHAIVTTAESPAGDNIRYPGEDLRAGSRVLAAGTQLGAAELGAAVAAGAAEVTVTARPRMAVLCTGDELRAPGEPLGPGEIHNSNAIALAALAARAGASVTASRRVPDDRERSTALLAEALEAADVVVISGGVSVGPHDHVKPALTELGVSERFWRVALRPGGPVWFGSRGETLVFGLPGNPVSAVVTFVLFVAPAVAALQDTGGTGQPARTAVLGTDVERNATREQAVRVRLHDEDGRLIAVPTGPQGSHLITSLLGADALALIPAGDGHEPAGSRIQLVDVLN